MRVVLFYHSLLSDWNHGNAHFLRGIASELIARGHDVRVYEPVDGWSFKRLLEEHGVEPLVQFHKAYPKLASTRYNPDTLDLDDALGGAQLVLVHEWNDPALVKSIGEHHARNGDYVLLFHDTHHRSVTSPASMAEYDLSGYDGVLAFGSVIRDLYLRHGWAKRAWTWHEAADTRVFYPIFDAPKIGDVVWVGNWGDDERTAELHEFLLEPVKALGLCACVFGVRYPDHAIKALTDAGIRYGGWLPNFMVPQIFAQYRVTVHVPRRPYVASLPGIPTIRPFEALACGIPLVCSPWNDAEHLFSSGRDFLVARDGKEMQQQLKSVLTDESCARSLGKHGRRTILGNHTCAHRVDELVNIYMEIQDTAVRTAL